MQLLRPVIVAASGSCVDSKALRNECVHQYNELPGNIDRLATGRAEPMSADRDT